MSDGPFDFLKDLFGIDEDKIKEDMAKMDKAAHEHLEKTVKELQDTGEWTVTRNFDSLTVSMETEVPDPKKPLVGYEFEFFNDGSAILTMYRSKDCLCSSCRS